MGRKAEPGIFYYSLKCNHIHNKKIRLLFNEFGSDGYWIWQCVLSVGYATKGYFFDCEDEEAMELFATDVCKKQVSLVNEVIKGCIRRGLFNEAVFDMFNILTSDHMQEMYLDATAERRRKGTSLDIIEEALLIKITDETRNIFIVPWNNEILPRKNPVVTRKNLQSKVDKKKENNYEPKGSAGVPPPDLQNEYKNLDKTKEGIYRFIRNRQPRFIEPYKDFWNLFAKERGFAQISLISDKRNRKFKKRITEEKFNLIEILRKAKESEIIAEGKWFSFDWILETENNYLKVIEGNYDKKVSPLITNGFDTEKYKLQRQLEEAEARKKY